MTRELVNVDVALLMKSVSKHISIRERIYCLHTDCMYGRDNRVKNGSVMR